MHITKKSKNNNAKSNEHIDDVINLNPFEDERDYDYYCGNTAEYWYREYSKLLESSEFIDVSLQKNLKRVSEQLDTAISVIKTLEAENSELSKQLDSLNASVPDNILLHWPKYADGSCVNVGDIVLDIDSNPFLVGNIIIKQSTFVLCDESTGLARIELKHDDVVCKPKIDSIASLKLSVSKIDDEAVRETCLDLLRRVEEIPEFKCNDDLVSDDS